MHIGACLALAAAPLAAAAPAAARSADLHAASAPVTAPSEPRAGEEQPAPAAAMPAPKTEPEIIVTARQREERVGDVPVAVTVIPADFLRENQIYAVKDVAAFAPGLNINSDTIGRAFISIRGVGTTLIDTVQPGVGIFIDGVYEPNTSYLNSPLLDVERIEVLRGPQGTLFGNNTLGGAINVVTRQPSNRFEGRADAAYAGTDDFRSLSGSVSGPIVPDVLQIRLGAAYHHRDGFQRNLLAGGHSNPLTQKSLRGTVRLVPAPWAALTATANYDRVSGGSAAYFNVAGPTDYTLAGALNVNNLATYVYKGVKLKAVFEASAIATRITAIAAYDRRTSDGVQDADLSPVDLLRAVYGTKLRTRSGELRFDTELGSRVSTLFGVSALRTTTDSFITVILVPALELPSSDRAVTEFEAIYGTAFVKLGDALDMSAGLRYDRQRVDVVSASTAGVYRADNLQPRLTLTRRWSAGFMTYGSVARGVRGGGQNGPGAPNLIYRGDSVWTFEAGTKLAALDRRLSLDFDVFYNDYDHFIGQNSLAPNTGGVGYVAVNLNTGHVTSYGAEAEVHARIGSRWRIDGGLTLLHARITDDTEYLLTTGVHVSSPRLILTPDWNFHLHASYAVPLGRDNVTLAAGIVGKGSRIGISLDPLVAPRLAPYYLVGGSVAWKRAGFEIALFANNLFNEKYIESYLDQSILARAGLPPPIAQNEAIQGERRRFGVRVGASF